MSEPVPILLLSYDLRFGGSERQLAEVAQHLDRDRFAPHVGCIRLQGGRRGELERAGVPLVEFSFPSFASRHCLAAGWRLSTYIKRHRIKLLHSFDVPGTMFGIPFGFVSKVPVVLSSQRAFRELASGYERRLLRFTDRLVDGVVVNSANLRAHLETSDGLSQAKTTLVYNSVDLERFTPGPGAEVLPECSVVIGSTAMLRPEKGVADLVEAFASVAALDSKVGLLLVGSGPLYEPIKARINELGLSKRCHMAGGVTDVRPWLRRMDIFVLPSLSEALSNSLLEAMATGCTAMATEVGGNPELVREGETGLLFEPGNAKQLGVKLHSLIENDELRKRLAASGQTFVRQKFSRASSLGAMADLYSQHLARVRAV
ncbi:MAG: glycosyltransferase family 4 protein [Acidobacteriota bacterium]